MSLGLGWVNVFPAIGLGGKIMKGMALAITLLLFSDIISASDCFDMAGRDYKIDPDLLRAISW
ncbi:lytic transglycosylase, partial [Klebsiella aerogenes]|nr:lytic transglycosylase [Klebsiella aerogenes]